MRRHVAACILILFIAYATLLHACQNAHAAEPAFNILHQNRLRWTCTTHTIHLPAEAPAFMADIIAMFDRVSPIDWQVSADPDADVVLHLEHPQSRDAAAAVVHWADDRHYQHADIYWDPNIADGPRGVSTLLHELGHIAGLGHVYATDKVMTVNPAPPFTRYQPGDLLGLAYLGTHCR